MMKKSFEQKIEDGVSNFLEENTFEELLEHFDITPEQAFITLFNSGDIDEDIMEEILFGQ